VAQVKTRHRKSTSAGKGLGSGRTDHRAVLFVSKKLGGFKLDFDKYIVEKGIKD
jgi:hypothetical protein